MFYYGAELVIEKEGGDKVSYHRDKNTPLIQRVNTTRQA